MYFIDSHCHIDFDWFDDDRDDVVRRAKDANVDILVNIGCEKKSNEKVRENSRKYSNVFFTAGIHPSDVDASDESVFEQIEAFSRDEKMVAVGEIGLDYFKYDGDRDRQRRFFSTAIRTAKAVGKPVVIHNRDSHDDMYEICKREAVGDVGGVMHCFAGTADYARSILDLGMHISLTGNITFKNAKYDEIIEAIPLERLMLETDSPFLTPHPHRGKRNEPAYIPLIAEKIAAVKGVSLEVVQKQTRKNTIEFFKLPLEGKNETR